MSSAEIKQVIGILCKQLNLLFHTNLKAEYFRLAKFNKTEEDVVPIFWKTMSLLTTKRSNSDVKDIKRYMESINYSSPLFYNLPEDFSWGSRELLLALCFIVATKLPSLIKEEADKSPFCDSFSLIDVNNVQFTNRLKVPTISREKDYKYFTMWIKGKIQQNRNMSDEYETQSVKICDKLNKTLNIKADASLNLNEILAIHDKNYCNEFLERSSFILDLLECYQEWTKKQSVFWKWMVTVLAERKYNSKLSMRSVE